MFVTLLLFVYRSATALVMGFVDGRCPARSPASSRSASVTASCMASRSARHVADRRSGLTLAIYLFVQSGLAVIPPVTRTRQDRYGVWRRSGSRADVDRGFAALMFSGFPGSRSSAVLVCGLVVAATTTIMMPHSCRRASDQRCEPARVRLQLLIDARRRLRLGGASRLQSAAVS